MEKKQLADIRCYHIFTEGMKEYADVTVVERELPMQQWPREQLKIEDRNYNVGNLTMQLIALRNVDSEGGRARVAINYENDGTITMNDIVEKEKASILRKVRNFVLAES